MKSKDVLRFIFVNPFEKIAGWQALGLGLIIVVLSTLIASYNDAYFNSAWGMQIMDSRPLWVAFAMLGISLASMLLMFLLTGVFFSKNFRVIDVIGTSFLARAPYLFLAVTACIPMPEILKDPAALIENVNVLFLSFTFWVYIVLTVLITVWFMALHYHAFRVSLNIRKSVNVIVFIVSIIFAGIFSTILIHVLL